MLRLFISIPIPQNISWTLQAIAEEYLPKLPRGSRVTPTEQMHFTLLFLGEMDEKYLPVISVEAERVIKDFRAPKITIDRLVYGPDPANLRMLWVSITKESESVLTVISAELARQFEDKKIPFFSEAGRVFKGHITLIRFPEGVTGFLPEPDDRLDFRFQPTQAELVKSTLTDSGSVYEVLNSFEFRK